MKHDFYIGSHTYLLYRNVGTQHNQLKVSTYTHTYTHTHKKSCKKINIVKKGVLVSIISLLADPNCSSPANVDAGVSFYLIYKKQLLIVLFRSHIERIVKYLIVS